MRLTVREDVHVRGRDKISTCPPASVARASSRATTSAPGVGPDLLEAARGLGRATVAWLGKRHGFDREEAYALASVACDLRIHEVVDAPNWVVGCFVPEWISSRTDHDRLRRIVGAG